MLELIHFIHIFSGIIFVGSVIFFEWVIGTAMMEMAPSVRKDLSQKLRKISGIVLYGSLAVVVITGISRLFMSGIIQTIDDLFSGYGLRATLAFVLIILFEAVNGPMYKRLRIGIDNEDDEMFIKYLTRSRLISLMALITIVFLMVSMRMGMY